eukprot:gene9251-biopygen4257
MLRLAEPLRRGAPQVPPPLPRMVVSLRGSGEGVSTLILPTVNCAARCCCHEQRHTYSIPEDQVGGGTSSGITSKFPATHSPRSCATFAGSGSRDA